MSTSSEVPVVPSRSLIQNGVLSACEVTRHISVPIQCMLWGKAGGRCEFAGCNKPLWKSSVTQEQVNIGQKAHIYAFSSAGPRGNARISKEALNNLDNLMLVCHECHRKLDARHDGGKYTASVLKEWKSEHERRMERAGGISAGKKSHILLYGANVGEHSSPLNYAEAAPALFPNRYPACDFPIELSTVNSSFSDRDTDFWRIEAENLRRKFEGRVRERITAGEVSHLSVFSFAPQPLLIQLGTLLGDIVPSDVYQLHREPAGWNWPEQHSEVPDFVLSRPVTISAPPALLISTSATVVPNRVFEALGHAASLWTISVKTPHNDTVKSKEQLVRFRAIARLVLDEIKAACGQNTLLHVFPATAVSLAVEFGRVRMPKAEMPMLIYDQVNSRGGFIPALHIPHREDA